MSFRERAREIALTRIPELERSIKKAESDPVRKKAIIDLMKKTLALNLTIAGIQ